MDTLNGDAHFFLSCISVLRSYPIDLLFRRAILPMNTSSLTRIITALSVSDGSLPLHARRRWLTTTAVLHSLTMRSKFIVHFSLLFPLDYKSPRGMCKDIMARSFVNHLGDLSLSSFVIAVNSFHSKYSLSQHKLLIQEVYFSCWA